MENFYWILSFILILFSLILFYYKNIINGILTLILAGSLMFAVVQMGHYPSQVKELYLKNPIFLALALLGQTYPGDGITIDDAKLNVKREGVGEIRSIKLIYLCGADPQAQGAANARNIYFSSLHNKPIDSKEELFWYVKGWQEELLLEYKTGNIIFYQRQGKVLIPATLVLKPYVRPVAKFGYRNYTTHGIKELFVNKGPDVWEEFASKIRIKGYQEDFLYYMSYNRESMVKEFMLLELYDHAGEPSPQREKDYRFVMDQIEKNFPKVWKENVQELMIIPVYIEKAFYQGEEAWIVVCNWTPGKDLETPGAKETGMPLARKAVMVISIKDYTLLHSLKN